MDSERLKKFNELTNNFIKDLMKLGLTEEEAWSELKNTFRAEKKKNDIQKTYTSRG